MRNYDHLLCQSRSGKSILFRVNIDDNFGKQTLNLVVVSGWRNKIALNHLFFQTKEWNDDVRRKYVGIHVLKFAKNQYEAIEFINIVKSLSLMEIHFWANKFMTNKKSCKAWRAFYKV